MHSLETWVLGGGQEDEVGSMDQAGQHVTRGGHEQLCGRTEEGENSLIQAQPHSTEIQHGYGDVSMEKSKAFKRFNLPHSN